MEDVQREGVNMASRAEESGARGSLGTVRNAMLLLELLSEGPAYRQLSDLADASGLSLATVHRLLRSLLHAQLVEQEERTSRYGLGPELTRLSQRYLARLPILGALSPYLVPLRDQIGVTIHVAILVRGAVVYVDRIDSDDSGLYRAAQRTEPALLSAAGRVLVSRSDDENWNLALDRVDEVAGKEALDKRDEWAKAPSLMMSGLTMMFPQEVAVPVLDGAGRAAAALAASLPIGVDQSRVDTVVTHLTHVASAAGRTLGHG